MGADRAAIQKNMFHVRVVGELLGHPLPDTFLTPPEEALVDAVPLPIAFREEPPRGAAAGHPKDALQEAAAVLLPPNVNIRTPAHKLQDGCPLVGTELYCTHASSLKPSLKMSTQPSNKEASALAETGVQWWAIEGSNL